MQISPVQHLQKPPRSAPRSPGRTNTTLQQWLQVKVSHSVGIDRALLSKAVTPRSPVILPYPPGRYTDYSMCQNCAVAVAVPPDTDLVRIAKPARFVAGQKISDPGDATQR